jgi:hypothetical protein
MLARGNRHEKVCNVVWSDGGTPVADGKLTPVDDTVDVASATWTDTIGDLELADLVQTRTVGWRRDNDRRS